MRSPSASLGLLACGDVRPGAHDLQRLPLRVLDHPERILNPDIVAVAMPETIFEGSSALLHQRTHLRKAREIIRMQPDRPEILVLKHLP